MSDKLEISTGTQTRTVSWLDKLKRVSTNLKWVENVIFGV